MDIETTGLDPVVSEIITIQFGPLDRYTAKPLQPLTILKRWELSEDELLKQFLLLSKITSVNKWAFIPIGYNLLFENYFLDAKCRQYNLEPPQLVSKPFIDLHPIGILMNRGEFKGSGLDKITNKQHSGRILPEWYASNQYHLIENYINQEFESFIEFLTWLYRRMPLLQNEFKSCINVGSDAFL